jgi:hypothetical protein
MQIKNYLGWASNILNLIIFIYIFVNTTSACFDKLQMNITAFGILVSILGQLVSSIEENKS